MFNWSDVRLYQSNFLQNPYFRTTTIYVAGTQEIEKERGENNKIVEKEGMGFVAADGFSLYTHLALILGLSFTYPY